MFEGIAAKLNEDLTPEELAAPTYLDWSDERIAKSVRRLAQDIGDEMGNYAIMFNAAMLIVDGVLKDSNGEKAMIEAEGYVLTVERKKKY